MQINISRERFAHIYGFTIFELPRRWDGINFHKEITSLLNRYCEVLKNEVSKDEYEFVWKICKFINDAIGLYFEGCPNKAYNKFAYVMKWLMEDPFRVYLKSGLPNRMNGEDPLKLFRVRNVQNNIPHNRGDIFHVPYNMRSKISSYRYSISGYPSLYLGTKLELSCEETPISTLRDLRIASRFELIRDAAFLNLPPIEVIELSVKPQDFLAYLKKSNGLINTNNDILEDKFGEIDLDSSERMGAYIAWYPLIAACSHIRVNKNDPFAAEYIIPQLMMQWVRSEYVKNKLFGVKYFSCSSIKASDMGSNYIFPANGIQVDDNQKYCDVLQRCFRMTMPVFVHEYESIQDCERHLLYDNDLQQIM